MPHGLSFLVDFLDSQSNLRMRKWKEERFYGAIRTGYSISGRSSGGFEDRCEFPILACKLISIFGEDSADSAGFQPLLFSINSLDIVLFYLR
jgi:hypothetical protein